MKTDVIITGHMRSFASCVHTLKWQVLRHFDVAAFYVSTVDDQDLLGADKLLAELFPDAPHYFHIVPGQPTLPEPVEKVRFEPYARSVPVQAVLRQLWQLEHGWNLRQRTGGDSPIVIRTRPDLFYHSFKSPEVYRLGKMAYTPYWGRFGGVNDRFAVMNTDAAPHYFQTFSRIGTLMEAGCPLHPESLVKASLEAGDVDIIDTLQTEFSTLRTNGECREPEISPFDFCHCSLNR